MPIALITGSTSGIGAGFAETYAKLDHNLVLVARDRARLEAQAARLHEQWQVDVEVLVADLGTDDGCAAVEARVADEELPSTSWSTMLASEWAATSCTRRWSMKSRSYGSWSARRCASPRPRCRACRRATAAPSSRSRALRDSLNRSTYGAAKAWAVRFSESLSLLLAGSGVRAIALCPGLVHTEFHERGDVDVSNAPKWMWLDVDHVVDACLDVPGSRQAGQHSEPSLQGDGRGRAARSGNTRRSGPQPPPSRVEPVGQSVVLNR